MDGNTREKVAEAKPIIRSILLALGKRATEREFRREYFNNSGEIFNDFLLGLGLNFYQFMRTIPDVCQVWKANTIEGNEVFVERVSTEESSHMDSLTIIKKKKKGLKQPVSGFSPSYQHCASTFRSSYESPGGFYRSSSANVFRPKVSTTPESVKPSVQSRISSMRFTSTSLKSLPPALHQRMKPVIFKGETSEDKTETLCKKAEKETSFPSSVPSIVKLLSSKGRTADSDSWSDDEDDPEVYRTLMTNVKTLKIQEKVSSLPPIKAKETNPFKMQVKIEVESEKENQPVLPAPKIAMKFAQASKKKVEASKMSQNVFDELRHQRKAEVVEKITVVIKNEAAAAAAAILENYQTLPFSIPSAKICETKVYQFFQVELVEFTSPSQFMFRHIRPEMKILLNEMSLHYETLEESKHLNIQELMPGMPVAVFYGGLWQRAEVISSKDSEAFIYFIDIGCKKRVEVSCLRYLEKTFAMSPRMCYKGSLFGLKPFNGEKFWRAGAIMKFMSKTKGKKMYASIKDLKDDFFHLSIVDDLLKKTCVSDYLVEMGFAEQVMDFDYSKNAILM